MSYPPDSPVAESGAGNHQTEFEVKNETTLSAAQRLLGSGHNPVALNFASATHPGGGFLSGARAQEEYLARSSGLYACLRNNPMYKFHMWNYDPLYSNYAIYSPAVPVFRADDGAFLEEPYTVAIITSPAANAAKLAEAEHGEIGPSTWQGLSRCSPLHNYTAIATSFWRPGAAALFGNDPNYGFSASQV